MDTVKTSWYPGHMARGFSVFKNEVKKAQAVIEVLDARIPISSRNRFIRKIISDKRKIVVLNKIDLVPRRMLKDWEKHISEEENAVVVSTNLATDRGSTAKIIDCLKKINIEIVKSKPRFGSAVSILKVVVIGIPNVGKSTLINRLAGKNRAKVGMRPGITLGKQWISFGDNFEMLDMPGILEPDLDDPEVSDKLCMTYAVSDKVIDPYLIAVKLAEYLKAIYRENDPDYNYPIFKEFENHQNGHETLDWFARHFNFLAPAGNLDLYRAACKLLKDYRSGLTGKFILDRLN